MNNIHFGRRGERNVTAKLTAEDVKAIRRLYANGATKTELAKLYKVDDSNIHAIVIRRTWRHVE